MTQDPRWDLLENPEVMKVTRAAAKAVNAIRRQTTERDDLEQEAAIFVATKADLVETVDKPEPEYGLLYHRLRADLMNLTERDDKHLRDRLSHTRLVEAMAA